MLRSHPIPYGTPREVVRLYQFHERGRRAMGKHPLPLLEWAEDRVGITGYEAVTLWMENKNAPRRNHARPRC